MKIAQVVSLVESVPPQSKNGLEFVVSWITEELVKRGHDVTLFAPGTSETQARLVSLLPQGTTIHMVPIEQSLLHMSAFSFWNGIYAATHAQNFDIIHCHNDIAAALPFISTPVVQTLHHPFVQEFLPPYLKNQSYKESMQFMLDQYRKINYVAVSEKQLQHFRQAEQDYFHHYSTIYNGIPVETFDFVETPGDYLLFIGYIKKDKGADVAVQVAKALNKKLILAGSNYGEEAFFDQHIKPYLNDDIHYVGPVNFQQKNELYKNALATLVPIHWDEPFGLTLVESQACGTPVIAFNKGASKEIIDHEKTGFVVENQEEMIEAVKKVDTLRRKDCRTWVEERFSVESMVDAYENLYQDIVNKNKTNT